MKRNEPSPPRWAEAILRSLLRPSDRESISGDLLEEYRAARRPALGAFRANAWYVKHVLSVLWRLIWPCALALAVLTLVPLIASRWSREGFVWHGSLVQAPGVSLVHALVYLWAGYHGSRRTHLIRTGMLAAGVTSFVGFTVLFAATAIRIPGLMLVPFSNPFTLVILSVLLLLALSYGILVGAVGGVIGRWGAPTAPQPMAKMLEHLIQDLRYAIRVLAKRPILLASTTISIGLGVGINVAVHSVLRSVLLQTGLPATAPDDLFNLEPGLSYPNYVDFRATDAFAGLAARQASTLTYRMGDSTTTIGAQVVSDNFFEVLGLQALYGRTFGSKTDARTVKDSTVVVISYGFWQRLGGDQTVVGRTLYLNGWPYVVAGVLPKGVYSMLGPLVSPSVYVPLGPRVNRGLDARNAAQFDITGRLRNGMTREQVSAALAVVARDLERRFPDANEGLSRTLSIAPRRTIVQRLASPAGRVVFTLAGAVYIVVGLILLVACANVAGLLLARAAERAHEITIRIALGATRGRLVQQFLAESFVVAALGCLAGATLWTVVTTVLPRTALIANAGVDLIPAPLSLVQCGLLAVVVTIACGIGPALTMNQRTPGLGRQPSRLRLGLKRWSLGQSLVAGQVGVSFVLLVGACALLFSMVRQLRTDPGFDLDHVISIQMRMPTTSGRPPFFTLRDGIATLPGVAAVSSGDLPVGLFGFERVFKVGATGDPGLSVDVNRVGPNYLETMGIPVLRGRDFRDEDVRQISSPSPVVVGETLARRYFRSLDVLGQQLVLARDPENGREAGRLSIVGVSQDSAVRVLGGDRVPLLYLPALSSSLVVRVAGSASAAVRPLERTVATLEPGAAVTVAPMATRLSNLLLPVRVATIFLGALGALGLVLAMTGLYGTVSYAAARRRFEIGVRIALGASSSSIVRLVLRDAVVIVCIGSMVGSGLSFVLTRAIWPLLAGDQGSMTPFAIVAVFVTTLMVAVVAALRPALAAASLNPVLALRQD